MIKLLLNFAGNNPTEFVIQDGERLNDAVTRATSEVPLANFKVEEVFQVVVNGLAIEFEFWSTIALKESDQVVISPRIRSGDAGQIFKTVAIIVVSIVAAYFLGPEVLGPIWGSLAVAGVTIGAALLLNALIPPPVASAGDLSSIGGSMDGSQMYSINGQSNQVQRYNTVPKVYGQFRMFPTIAAVPYTELSVDKTTGETIQYLYAIYDFGLGTVAVTDLKVGDTPLSTDSFDDFQWNFVDTEMGTPQDKWDQALLTGFQYYRGNRKITSLSIALNDLNDESVQNSDINGDGFGQEIILDFVCPAGLYSFSSGGTLGKRHVTFEVDFAPVGTTNWHAYNDLNYVSSHEVVGGEDVNAIHGSFVATITSTFPGPSTDTWYEVGLDYGGYSFFGRTAEIYVKRGVNKLLLGPDVYPVGSKVFYGNRLLGIIQSTDTVTHSPNIELTLDRVITNSYRDVRAYEWSSFEGVRSVNSLRIDNTGSAAAIITGKSTSPVYGSVRFTPKTAGQYQVRVRRAAVSGDYTTQTGDQVTWGTLTTALDSPPISTTKRHTFLELKIKATDQLNGNISTLSGIATSVLPIYDPVTKTFTRDLTANPAWILVDLLTGEVNKRAVSVGQLDYDSIVEWANFCDAIPTPPPTQTFTQPRFQANFILDYQTTLQDLLQQLGGAAQASLNIINGKYGVLIDKERTTPVQIFTPRNSRDFSSTRVYGPRPDALKISFIDPASGWEANEINVFDNGFNLVNAVNFDSLTAWGATNHEQAWRFGRYMIAQNALRQESITLTVDFEYLACTRGDYVQITQDVMEVGGTPARVKAVVGSHITIDDSMDIDPTIAYGYVYRSVNGTIVTSTLTATAPNQFNVAGAIPAVGDLIVIGALGQIVLDCIVRAITPNDDSSATLVLVEKADAIHDYESTDLVPTYNPNISVTSLPDIRPPLAVENLVIADTGWICSPLKSGIDYFITLTWNMPQGSVFELFEIWVNDGRGYRSIATTKIKTYTYDVAHERLDIEHDFKVVAVSATGKKLELIAMPEVTITPNHKTTPPDNVASLDMSITNQVLQLSWPPLDDCSVDQYVLRYSPETNDIWEASVPLMTVHKNVTSVSVQARTGIYFIKAIDTEGNLSVNPAQALTTIPDLIDINIIDTLNDAPTFVGEFDSTEKLGEAVILSEQTHGDPTTVVYYAEGFYTFAQIFDLGDIFSVRLQSLIRADGYKKGELMSDWVHLADIDHLNSALHSDWNIALQYRASDTFEAMSDWVHLSDIDHINSGAGIGFTSWRDVPTTGDATGRVFQFRSHMESLTANVTPRFFDATVQVDMPDRIDSFDNQTSDAVNAKEIDFDPIFAGPSPAPNVQVSIDNAQTGDYWTFDSKTLAAVKIRFYDKNGVQVVRQFDLVAKGYGRQHTITL